MVVVSNSGRSGDLVHSLSEAAALTQRTLMQPRGRTLLRAVLNGVQAGSGRCSRRAARVCDSRFVNSSGKIRSAGARRSGRTIGRPVAEQA